MNRCLVLPRALRSQRRAFATALALAASLLLGAGARTAIASLSFLAPTTLATLGHPSAIAPGDFNHDGNADLAVAYADSAKVSIFLGNGDGTFTTRSDYAVPGGGYSLATGDFNRDGKLDLALAGWNGSLAVLLGYGDGRFYLKSSSYSGSEPAAVAVTDLNGDGISDLVVAVYGSSKVAVLLGYGDGRFGVRTEYSVGAQPWSIVAGDFDGDGRPDVAVANQQGHTVSVLRGDGTGALAAHVDYPAGPFPYGIATADLNGDARLDLVVANSLGFGAGNVSVLLGTGGGAFGTLVAYATGAEPHGIALADLDGDGVCDIATADYATYSNPGSVSVLLGTGTGSFGANADYPAGRWPGAVAIADLDGDTRPDLAVADGTGNTISLLRSVGAAFTSTSITAAATSGGTIDPAGQISVGIGADQTFTITPNTGQTVTAVYVDGAYVGRPSSYTFHAARGPHTISVSFGTSVITWLITSNPHLNGSIQPPIGVVVADGADQSFTISPAIGYTVASVDVDSVAVGAVSSYTFHAVHAPHNIEAWFAVYGSLWKITATAGPNGAIGPAGIIDVANGDDRPFFFYPSPGYAVANVVVDGAPVGTPTSYTFQAVHADHSIAVSFVNGTTWTIATAAGAHGSISPAGPVPVNDGADQSFTITPESGYVVASVTMDGVAVGAVTSYTFHAVHASHTLAASFVPVGGAWTIAASAGSGGTITPSGSVSVADGADQSFTMTPDSGYVMSSLVVDGVPRRMVTSYTFTAVHESHTITVAFAPAGVSLPLGGRWPFAGLAAVLAAAGAWALRRGRRAASIAGGSPP